MIQNMELDIEFGVDIPPDTSYVDLRERAEAACKSIEVLEEYGLEVDDPNDEEQEVATQLLSAYASDPEAASKVANTKNTSAMTPASLQHLRSYLNEFGSVVVAHAVEVRNLVTNKLLEETMNPDPRVRIRALELLGKITEVGLFSERQEVLVTHQSAEELKSRLRQKLERIVNQREVREIEGDVINVDEELGL